MELLCHQKRRLTPIADMGIKGVRITFFAPYDPKDLFWTIEVYDSFDSRPKLIDADENDY